MPNKVTFDYDKCEIVVEKDECETEIISPYISSGLIRCFEEYINKYIQQARDAVLADELEEIEENCYDCPEGNKTYHFIREKYRAELDAIFCIVKKIDFETKTAEVELYLHSLKSIKGTYESHIKRCSIPLYKLYGFDDYYDTFLD